MTRRFKLLTNQLIYDIHDMIFDGERIQSCDGKKGVVKTGHTLKLYLFYFYAHWPYALSCSAVVAARVHV
jgi:hypothetical protein